MMHWGRTGKGKEMVAQAESKGKGGGCNSNTTRSQCRQG
jgi:hypothetical protein